MLYQTMNSRPSHVAARASVGGAAQGAVVRSHLFFLSFFLSVAVLSSLPSLPLLASISLSLCLPASFLGLIILPGFPGASLLFQRMKSRLKRHNKINIITDISRVHIITDLWGVLI